MVAWLGDLSSRRMDVGCDGCTGRIIWKDIKSLNVIKTWWKPQKVKKKNFVKKRLRNLILLLTHQQDCKKRWFSQNKTLGSFAARTMKNIQIRKSIQFFDCCWMLVMEKVYWRLYDADHSRVVNHLQATAGTLPKMQERNKSPFSKLRPIFTFFLKITL